MGGAAGAAFFPAFSAAKQPESKSLATGSTALFYTPSTTLLWDTWVYHHNGKFHLYYMTGPRGKWNGIGMAVSNDGVHWDEVGKVIEKPVTGVDRSGAGTVWAVRDEAGNEKFIMGHSEWQVSAESKREDGLRQTLLFSESQDLIHWQRLGAESEFHHDTRWYDGNGRWDNLWPIPRPEGGFYGYWVAQPNNKKIGIGFGESLDGVTWKALESPDLPSVPASAEVPGVYRWKDKCYLTYNSFDIRDSQLEFEWGNSTLVGDFPSGPFSYAPKNRRLLVGDTVYFTRFADTPDGVLVNHHSWENDDRDNRGHIYMAPLKRADWDDEGTLRLKWWDGNERAKAKRVFIQSQLVETAFDPNETLILEGVMPLTSSPTGLYLQGSGEKGTGFLVHENGLVEYGDINRDGSGFEKKGYVDRELPFEDKAHFRLIRKGRITEFYLNDYLMQCYSLPEQGTGHIGLIGPPRDFSKLKAWYCA